MVSDGTLSMARAGFQFLLVCSDNIINFVFINFVMCIRLVLLITIWK